MFKQNLRLLDQYLMSRDSVNQLRLILNKLDKCCLAVEKNLNLADVLSDQANFNSLREIFGDENISIGLQLILKVSLADFVITSFSINSEIGSRKKIDFLHHTVGGWKQFDMILCLNTSDSITIVNPKNREHWKNLESIPRGTLASVFIRTVSCKRNLSQEKIACERFKAAFSLVQSRNDLQEKAFTPVAWSSQTPEATSHPQNLKTRPEIRKSRFSFGSARAKNSTDKLSLSFQVVINKTDTFVHAGNAHLIMSHASSYLGRIEMFVMRGNKTPILLEPDSIWSAEIRNGETVVFDFYGDKPSDDFVKELLNRTNKYTQMDKVANE